MLNKSLKFNKIGVSIVYEPTYLKVRFIRNAFRPPKFNDFFLRKHSHPFWWHLSALSVLQKTATQDFAVQRNPIHSTQQPIHNFGRNSVTHLPDLLGVREDRNNSALETQRRLSISHGIARIPRSNNIATLSSENGTLGLTKIAKAPRQIAFVDESEAKTSYANHFRPGLHRSRSLRQIGAGSYRIQSSETRQTLIPSAPLLRCSQQGFLARGTSSRRHSYRDRDHRFSERRICQITSFGETCNYKSGQGLFRPQDNRVFGIQRRSFCHRCEAYPSHKEKIVRFDVRKVFIRHRNSRALVPTDQMGKEISFRGHTTTYSGRSIRTAHAVHPGQIQLPDNCDKHETHAAQYVEVLQWPRSGRTDYQRTQGKLSLGQDPNEAL